MVEYIPVIGDVRAHIDEIAKIFSEPSIVSSENHRLFHNNSNLILKEFSNEEFSRAVKNHIVASATSTRTSMNTHGVFSLSDKYFLICDYLQPSSNSYGIVDLIKTTHEFHIELNSKLELLMNSTCKNYIKSELFQSINMKQEFMSRAVYSRPSETNRRFDRLDPKFAKIIYDEYSIMFAELNSLTYIHGDCRKANFCGDKAIDFDHVRLGSPYYDFARLITNERDSFSKDELSDIVSLAKLDNFDMEMFWPFFFHSNITLAAYAQAIDDDFYFSKYVDRSILASQEMKNYKLESTIRDYLEV